MKANVLIFPAGEINSVELHAALSYNVNIVVYGASSIERHGAYIFENYRSGLPLITAPDFIDEFNKLLEEWAIHYIFPTHDTVALFLAEWQEKIRAKVITADYNSALICRDKRKTYELFKEYDFCPKLYGGFIEFPCFIKPRDGQGSAGTKLIEDINDVPVNIKSDEYVICEYLPGDEMTVDCVTDKNGKLVAVLPRKRLRLMAGVCVAGESVDASDEIQFLADTINRKMKFLGLWYFQIKKGKKGKYKLLEVSTRCAGTMCLSRARGVNIPLLSVYAAMGRELSVYQNPFSVIMDRILISRYKINYDYNKVYIDYDDTVVSDGQVILPVIRFLYQCRNKDYYITLLTRHECEHEDTVEESLEQHGIAVNLFDAIVRLSFEEKKADYIEPNKAIFIDNAYTERKQVHDIYNIPVFDVEGIEVITDWRA